MTASARKVVRPRKPGRPPKLTPETQKVICDCLAAGNSRTAAAAAGDIDEDTFREWIARGEGRDARGKAPIYAAFAVAVKKAEGNAERLHVMNIRDAAKQHWQASAWWLERRNPEQWGLTTRVKQEVTGKDGGPIAVNVSHRVTSFDWESFRQELAYQKQRAVESEGGGDTQGDGA